MSGITNSTLQSIANDVTFKNKVEKQNVNNVIDNFSSTGKISPNQYKVLRNSVNNQTSLANVITSINPSADLQALETKIFNSRKNEQTVQIIDINNPDNKNKLSEVSNILKEKVNHTEEQMNRFALDISDCIKNIDDDFVSESKEHSIALSLSAGTGSLPFGNGTGNIKTGGSSGSKAANILEQVINYSNADAGLTAKAESTAKVKSNISREDDGKIKVEFKLSFEGSLEGKANIQLSDIELSTFGKKPGNRKDTWIKEKTVTYIFENKDQAKDFFNKDKGIGKNFSFTNDENKITKNCCFKKETDFENKKQTETSYNSTQIVDKTTSKKFNKSLSTRNLIARTETSDFGTDFEITSTNKKKVFFASKDTTSLTININKDNNKNLKDASFSYNINVEKISQNQSPDALIRKLHRRFDSFVDDFKKENNDIAIDSNTIKSYITASVENLFNDKDNLFKKGDLKEKSFDSFNIELSIPTPIPGLAVKAQVNGISSNVIQIKLPLKENMSGELVPKEEDSAINVSNKTGKGISGGVNYSPYAPIEFEASIKIESNSNKDKNLTEIDSSNIFISIPNKIKKWEEMKTNNNLNYNDISSTLKELISQKNLLNNTNTKTSKLELEKSIAGFETYFIEKFNSILNSDINDLEESNKEIHNKLSNVNISSNIIGISNQIKENLSDINIISINLLEFKNLGYNIDKKNQSAFEKIDNDLSNLNKDFNDIDNLFNLSEDLEEKLTKIVLINKYDNKNLNEAKKDILDLINIKNELESININIKNCHNTTNNTIKNELEQKSSNIIKDVNSFIENINDNLTKETKKYFSETQNKLNELLKEVIKPNKKSNEISEIKKEFISMQSEIEYNFTDLEKTGISNNLLTNIDNLNKNLNEAIVLAENTEKNLQCNEVISAKEKLLNSLKINIHSNSANNNILKPINSEVKNISNELESVSKELSNLKESLENTLLTQKVNDNILKTSKLYDESQKLEKLSSSFMIINDSLASLKAFSSEIKLINDNFNRISKDENEINNIKLNLIQIKSNLAEIKLKIKNIDMNIDKNLNNTINKFNSSINTINSSIKLLENRLSTRAIGK
ncbi:MAG: hypothetical protein U0457_17740 [Candidatus Sericytochromatia bacterium]